MAVLANTYSGLKLQIEHEFRRRTVRSAALHAEAARVLPGGDTRSATWYTPYPVFMERGRGCRLWDVDGNEYLDLLNNYTSLIHGHAHSRITEAIAAQSALGTAHAAPTEVQLRLAEALCRRMVSLERVRFCNSGTEATLFAIRAAKAFTGRNKIVKMEGGYHGTHEPVEISIAPPPAEAGPPEAPRSVAASTGLFRGVAADVVVVPFNDLASTQRIIEQNAGDLAAVIVEPVLGSTGMIPATADYLRGLREATKVCGALLILDEIITFRLAYGGAQEVYGVRPDLTTLGKIIGGGLPVGAFGGRADVMAVFDPLTGGVPHSGTFNGNAATMAAGAAALELLTREEITRLNGLGERLRQGLRAALRASGVTGQVSGMGSLAAIHFSAEPVTSYRAAARANSELKRLAHLGLLNRGMFAGPRGMFCISTPMREAEIDQAEQAFRNVLCEISDALK